MGNYFIGGPHCQLQYTSIIRIESNQCSNEDQLFSKESSGKQEIVCFLSDVNPVTLVANGHAKELNDSLHSNVHGLEVNLECVSGLLKLGVCADGIPYTLEMSLRLHCGR